MAGKRVEVHVTLTNDLSRILNAVKAIKLSGDCDFVTSLNIATLTLKHRQNKNQKQRIIMFVGSPVKHSIEDMVQTGKKLKKYNIAVDVISFGNVDENREALKSLIDAVNNSNNSSITEIPVGFYLMDSLFSSSIMSEQGGYEDVQMGGENIPQGENVGGNVGGNVNNNINNQQGGGMTQFERDINMAIQASLDEERRKTQGANTTGTAGTAGNTNNVNTTNDVEMKSGDDEADELEQARLMSMKEHEQVVRNNNDEENNIKDELLENQDFIKDILQGIDTTEIKDEDVEEMVKKVKEDKEKEDSKDKKTNEGDKDKDNK